MIILLFLFGWLVFVSWTNLILMRCPRGEGPICFEVLIPARNEEHNLPRVIPPLVAAGVRVTVFDDESTDGTARVISELGAMKLSSPGPLPDGWKGKPRACDQLARVAQAEWAVYLDADTIPSPEFAATLSNFLASQPGDVQVVTGFPRMLPGRGLEPAYLGWVPWILLATNPFGLVSRTKVGHNGFTNGQFSAWRTQLLQTLKPYEAVRGEILEDVKIGRYLAQRKIRVEVANVSGILSVRMYENLKEAIAGMTKNSADIAGSFVGSVVFAGVFVFFATACLMDRPQSYWLLPVLLVTKLITDLIVRAPLWTLPLFPLTCFAAALTIIRSAFRKRRGVIEWKGRTYKR